MCAAATELAPSNRLFTAASAFGPAPDSLVADANGKPTTLERLASEERTAELGAVLREG
jgi:hypothetical protein